MYITVYIHIFPKIIYSKKLFNLRVIKIKRKVVLHGPSTLTISLPASWVKKFNIKKGDELNLEEFGKELRINTEKAFDLEKKQITIKDLKRLGKSNLTSSYRQGYSEIDLNYDDSNYINIIQDILSKEITGFEIIKQSSNSCLIKDLTGHNQDEFDNVLRRIWLLLIDLSKESFNALQKRDVARLKEMYLMDYSINKFSNYCLRLLIKKGHVDFKKTPLYYHLIKNLEETADNYKDLCTFYSGNIKKIDDDLIIIFTRINEHLNEIYQLFYEYDEQQMEDLFRETKLTHNKISNSKNSTAYCLSTICENIRSLLTILVEINL